MRNYLKFSSSGAMSHSSQSGYMSSMRSGVLRAITYLDRSHSASNGGDARLLAKGCRNTSVLDVLPPLLIETTRYDRSGRNSSMK